MNRTFSTSIVGLLGVLTLLHSARGDGPQPLKIGPEAKARLDALIAAYRALPAYADQGQVSVVVKVGDREQTQSLLASIRFARPNKLDVRTDLVRVVSDGSKVTSSVGPLRKYFESPAPKRFTESSLRGGPLGAIEFGGVTGLPIVHVLNLVIGDDPERLIYDFTPRVVLEADREVNGVSYKILRLDESDNHDWRFLIDPKTGLLSFVDLVIEGDATKSSIAGEATHVVALRWAAGPISTEVPPADSFTFQPDKAFTLVKKLEGELSKKPEVADHPLVGKPAPDFTLDVLDGPGKYRKVAKTDLAGKVVLVDFWATWCGPCLAELPDIQELIEAYGKAGKEVVVVALSIDQGESGDFKEPRAKVDAKLSEMKLTLKAEGGNPVGLIALDPSGKVAEAYGVAAIPFVVVIDPQGVIRNVHVGVTEGEVLRGEIDSLLDAKPPQKK